MFLKVFKLILVVAVMAMMVQQSGFCFEPEEGHHDDAAHCDMMHHHCTSTCHTSLSADTLARSLSFESSAVYSIKSIFKSSYTNPTIYRLKRPPNA